MLESTVDLLLHPVRMRIIQALIGGRTLSVADLGAELDDIPPATLYRHLNALTGAGILRIVEERRVRGAVERIYALNESAVSIAPEDLARESPADLMRYFTTFLAGLLGEYGRYLGRETFDHARDGIRVNQVTLNLSESEFTELLDDLDERIRRALTNEPSPDRQSRIFTRIVLPASTPSRGQ